MTMRFNTTVANLWRKWKSPLYKISAHFAKTFKKTQTPAFKVEAASRPTREPKKEQPEPTHRIMYLGSKPDVPGLPRQGRPPAKPAEVMRRYHLLSPQ